MKKSTKSATPAATKRVEIVVRYDQPLGYGVMNPVDGGSLDEALVRAWAALGVRKDDILVLTLEKRKEPA